MKIKMLFLIILVAVISSIATFFVLQETGVSKDFVSSGYSDSVDDYKSMEGSEVLTTAYMNANMATQIDDDIFACLYKNGLFEMTKSYNDIPKEIFEKPNIAEYDYTTFDNVDAEVLNIIYKVVEQIYDLESFSYGDENVLMTKKKGNYLFCLFAGWAEVGDFENENEIEAFIIIDYSTKRFWINYGHRFLIENGYIILRGNCDFLEEDALMEIGADFVGVAVDILVVDSNYDVEICSSHVYIDFDSSRTSVFNTICYYDDSGKLILAFRDPRFEGEGFSAFNGNFEEISGECFMSVYEEWVDPIEEKYDVSLGYW